MTAQTKRPKQHTSGLTFSQRVDELPPSRLLLINFTVLGLSIIFLILSLTIQHRTNPEAVPFNGFSLGQSVSMGESTMRVNSVTPAKGSGIFTAPSGQHYLIVSLSIKDTSEQPINIYPSTDIYLKDPTGKVTFLTPYDLSNPLRGGELLPADQISGQLSFLVPIRSTQKLYIDAAWSGGVIPFVVQK